MNVVDAISIVRMISASDQVVVVHDQRQVQELSGGCPKTVGNGREPAARAAGSRWLTGTL